MFAPDFAALNPGYGA